MAYLVLARKYRPQIFADLVGQEPISQTLRNAIRNGRIAHSYLFSGPRGVGKTSAARILAKAVNCLNRAKNDGEPCNDCDACREITSGSSLDVIEIDGASNRGIDEIRNLRENVKYSPARYSSKIYIIDEVHMLTKEAFNALLKTLEEPPEHIIFIFATTEPHNVPTTILSRCQRYDFKRIPVHQIADHLKLLLSKEGVESEEEAVLEIARSSGGSLRDSETLLDQLIVFGAGRITAADVEKSLGLVKSDVFKDFLDFVIGDDREKALLLIQRLNSEGFDFVIFFNGLVDYLRNVMIVQNLDTVKAGTIIDASQRELEAVKEFSLKIPSSAVFSMIDALIESQKELKWSAFPQIFTEIMFFRLTEIAKGLNLRNLNTQVQAIRKHLGGNPVQAMPAQAMPAQAMPAQAMPAQAMTGPAMPAPAMPGSGAVQQQRSTKQDPAQPGQPMPAQAPPTQASPAANAEIVANSSKMFDKYYGENGNNEKKKHLDLTLDLIRGEWPRFLSGLTDPNLAILKNFGSCCGFELWQEGTLTLSLNSRIAFDALVKREVIESLRQSLEKFFQVEKMAVKFVYRDPPPKETAPSGRKETAEKPATKDEADHEEIYKKAVSILGGSFVRK